MCLFIVCSFSFFQHQRKPTLIYIYLDKLHDIKGNQFRLTNFRKVVVGMLGWTRTHILPYTQSRKASTWDCPDLNLTSAVYSPLISTVRFLIIRKASFVKLNLFLRSLMSYQSGPGPSSFQDTRICLLWDGGSQDHSISRILGSGEEFSVSCTDSPTVLFNVQEELGSLTAWKPGEGELKLMEERTGGNKVLHKFYDSTSH